MIYSKSHENTLKYVDTVTLFFLYDLATLLDHCLKSLHNTVKHMNLSTVV